NTKDNLSVRAANKNEIDTIVNNKQGGKVATANILSGTSSKQGLTVGTVIKVTGAQRGISSFEVKNYGEYIITKITHTATGSSEYGNEFEAISSGVAILPEPLVALPEASTQLATVLSNEDPDQKGRVQVQFQWQTAGMKTGWIRVMTPDAGSSDHHSQNRGHVFVPEVGDQVMVGFRYNDPNRPFVMGSMYHGNNGAGGQNQNNIKSIITKSGHTLEFNDTNRQESIIITDKNNNIIFIDTANSSIMISAPENIDIKAKNISITATETITNQARNISSNASENVSVGAGENVSTHAGETFSIAATDIKERATNVFERFAKEVSETAEKVAVDSTKENMELTSKKQVISQSGEKVKLF
ncbi:phage baseplate assembly protein V, partial [Tenacibaculum finnmarkense]